MSWHRKGFRLFWTWISRRKRNGRPKVSTEIRALIRRMAEANPFWGSPRIHGELLKLGLEVSERTVLRLIPKCRKLPSQTRRAFLYNHVQELIAIDFLTIPTATFRVLLVLVVLAHHRRQVIHFNITAHPTSEWTAHRAICCMIEIRSMGTAFVKPSMKWGRTRFSRHRDHPGRVPTWNDWVDSAGVRGPSDCAERSVSTKNSKIVPSLLPGFSHAFVTGQGRSGRARRSAARTRSRDRACGDRRIAPSLRTTRSLSTGSFSSAISNGPPLQVRWHPLCPSSLYSARASLISDSKPVRRLSESTNKAGSALGCR